MSGERILVVDDGRENRDFVVNYILKPHNFRPLVARDGQEGLRKALAERPDLILLDLQMPRMNGIQVLKGLAREGANIPVILMTFHGSEEIAVEVFRLGVRDYVKKPYTVDEMLGAIERSLTETRLRREKEALTERLLSSNRELQRRIKELNVLYKIGKSVTAHLDVEQLAARVVEAAIYVTGAEEGSLFLLDGEQLVCRAAKYRTDGRARPVWVESNDPLALSVLRNREPVMLLPEDLAEQRAQHPDYPVAVVYTPLTMGARALGVLGVDNVTDGAKSFSEQDVALLGALADYAAIAVENATNYAALESLKESEKQQIRQTFERYVAPSVVGQALDYPDELALGGARREISVVFADLHGYSAFSEQADPEEVVERLNEYFTLAADIIMAQGGTVDKYQGDAVMAIFNAPQQQPDHPLRAVQVALALREAVTQWNATREGNGPPLSFSIGLHLGEAVVGNIGAAQMMNYTAIGDAVNLAKRLEEHAEPGQILITDSVVDRLADQVRVTARGRTRVKGRQQPVTVYELLGLS